MRKDDCFEKALGMSTQVEKKSRELGQAGIFGLLFRYSLPTTIACAAFTVYNVVDRLFIARAGGSDAIAGIAVTFPIFMICISVGMLFGTGGGAIASIRLGEGNHAEADRVLGNVVGLFLICGVVLSCTSQVFMEPLLHLFGASENTLPYARPYMRILMWVVVADFLAMGMNDLLRSEGNPGMSMRIMVVGAVLNIFLDWLFIFKLGMGVRGAALATGIAKVVSATWILVHFTIGSKRVFTLRWRNLCPRWSTTLSILHIGSSPFLMMVLRSTVIAYLNRTLLVYGGDLAVGAMGVVFSLQMLFFMPAMGLEHGTQPIFGFNFGARNHARLRQAVLCALVYAVGAGLLGLIVAEFFPGVLVHLFSRDDAALEKLAIHALRVVIFTLPVGTAVLIGTSYFQSTRRPHLSIGLNCFREGLGMLAFITILPRFWGLEGLWLASPAADLLTGAVTFLLLYREFRRLGRGESRGAADSAAALHCQSLATGSGAHANGAVTMIPTK
jgi:putative MATE family efflux protein